MAMTLLISYKLSYRQQIKVQILTLLRSCVATTTTTITTTTSPTEVKSPFIIFGRSFNIYSDQHIDVIDLTGPGIRLNFNLWDKVDISNLLFPRCMMHRFDEMFVHKCCTSQKKSSYLTICNLHKQSRTMYFLQCCSLEEIPPFPVLSSCRPA